MAPLSTNSSRPIKPKIQLISTIGMSSSSSESKHGFRFRAYKREQYSVFRARLEAKLRAKNLWNVSNPSQIGKEETQCNTVPNTTVQVSGANEPNSQSSSEAPSPQVSSLMEKEKHRRKTDKATHIIILSALGDVPFRVVEGAIGDPVLMISNLDDR